MRDECGGAGYFRDLLGIYREGKALDCDVEVRGAATFRGYDVGVVGGGHFVDDADEAMGPGVRRGLGSARGIGKARFCVGYAREVKGHGERGDDDVDCG